MTITITRRGRQYQAQIIETIEAGEFLAKDMIRRGWKPVNHMIEYTSGRIAGKNAMIYESLNGEYSLGLEL